METSFNLCNLEGRGKVLSCSISCNNFRPILQHLCLAITPQRPFWGIPRSRWENESIACYVKMRESGDNLEDAEVLGMAFMSHQGSLECGGENDSPILCTNRGGDWRQVSKLQIFFAKIFYLKVFNHPAVINTSFSGQVVSISAEPRNLSHHPYSPKKTCINLWDPSSSCVKIEYM